MANKAISNGRHSSVGAPVCNRLKRLIRDARLFRDTFWRNDDLSRLQTGAPI